ncbi:glycosyltransferase [Phascolarctobacterium faecium]|uniref:glycosyltransferase n=1 Tax=Phascolarctobacterium faecium TaxID=33025 RepID=UPI002666B1D0|nr:glycosyltransferase [Phascolarctobacterium faecium]
MENFSVLMSVYKNEKAEYLELAIDSILKQTIVPNEIVIVKDGTLTHELEMILDKFSTKYEFFKFLEFKENRGLGLALRDGVLSCSNELIARMDTDDISKLERFEKQLTYIANHPEVAVLGTCIEEFSKNINAPDSATILPLTHDEIVKFSKKRNPFRHMTVLFKRSAVISSGNYRDFLWFEDYHLWLRLMKKGYIMANLHDVLVSVRADDDMFSRRGGYKYLKQDIKFQIFMYENDYINFYEFIRNVFIRSAIRCVPNKVRNIFYKKILRSSID